MEPPVEDYYRGQTHGARWSLRGIPVSVSNPALVIVAVLTVLPMAVAMIRGDESPFAYLAAAPALYIGVWIAERVDPAIFRLLAAWLRRLVLVGWRAWGAQTRDPFGR